MSDEQIKRLVQAAIEGFLTTKFSGSYDEDACTAANVAFVALTHNKIQVAHDAACYAAKRDSRWNTFAAAVNAIIEHRETEILETAVGKAIDRLFQRTFRE